MPKPRHGPIPRRPRALEATRLGGVLTAAAAVLVACAGGPPPAVAFPADATVRAAENAPDRFVLPRIPITTECQSPINDPRNGARLRLVRSYNGRGDYEVPAGAYGALAQELLRVDCGRGYPIGLVKR